MSTRKPSLSDLLAAEREAMVPSDTARARNLEGLQSALAQGRPPLVEAPAPAASPSAGSSGLLWLAGALLVTGLLATLVWSQQDSGSRGEADAVELPAADEMPGAPSGASRPASVELPDEPGAAEASPESQAPAPDEGSTEIPLSSAQEGSNPSEPEAAAPGREAGGTSSRRPKKPRPAKTPPADEEEHDGFAAELRMLKRAKARVDDGDNETALRLLDQAANRFGKGSFDEERRALRVRVLCELGREDAANGAAKAFFRDYPASPQTERVRHACD